MVVDPLVLGLMVVAWCLRLPLLVVEKAGARDRLGMVVLIHSSMLVLRGVSGFLLLHSE